MNISGGSPGDHTVKPRQPDPNGDLKTSGGIGDQPSEQWAVLGGGGVVCVLLTLVCFVSLFHF